MAALVEVCLQGKPPATTSTFHSSTGSGGNVRTSSHRRTCGQCLASVRRRNSSSATCHEQVRPARSNPRSRPPMPAKRLPNVTIVHDNLKPLLELYAPQGTRSTPKSERNDPPGPKPRSFCLTLSGFSPPQAAGPWTGRSARLLRRGVGPGSRHTFVRAERHEHLALDRALHGFERITYRSGRPGGGASSTGACPPWLPRRPFR